MEGNKLDRNEEEHRTWKIIMLIIEIMWIIILVSACCAFVQMITARAATPYIDGKTGEWVITDIYTQDDAIDITEAPPINQLSEALDQQDEKEQLVYLDRFYITYYCPCRKCNGNSKRCDRFGNPLVWGTVAVDPKVITLHTQLKIEGYDTIFTALDTGGSTVQGKHIDIFVPVSHAEAYAMCKEERKKVWKLIQ